MKRSLQFLGATPECATATGIYRAWRSLPEPVPLPTDCSKRAVAVALLPIDPAETPWHHLALYHRPTCIRIAVIDVLRGWRFERVEARSLGELQGLDESWAATLTDMSDADLAERFATVVAEEGNGRFGVHPLVSLVKRYAGDHSDILRWVSDHAFCMAIDIAFDVTMRACAAVAYAIGTGDHRREVGRRVDMPRRPPYDKVSITSVTLDTKGFRVGSEASSAVWQGLASVLDDLGNEYLMTWSQVDVLQQEPRGKARVLQRFYPAVREGARQLRLLINPLEPDDSTAVVRM